MLFYEFANILHTILAGGANTGDFIKDLIINITDIPDDIENNPIHNLTNVTLKKYFNGGISIRQTAKKINKYIDEDKFVTYIGSLSNSAMSSICTKLKPYCPNITEFNVGEECATLFKSILEESVTTSNRKKATIKKVEKQPEEDILNIEYGSSLLIEANGICPNDNCCETLYISENCKSTTSYKITQIDPCLQGDSPYNLIALCHKCSHRYSLSQNNEKIERMKEIKRRLILESKIKETLSNSELEIGINKVLRKIEVTSYNELTPLNYNPVNVKNKITKENVLLLRKNINNVTDYYIFIKDIFMQLEKEGKLDFELLCMQIRSNYKKLKKKNLSQIEIYNALVQWLKNNTNEDEEPCEIIISYFVQNCEVFDVITK